MTITSSYSPIVYTGQTGSETVFTYPFEVVSESHLQVLQTDTLADMTTTLVLTTDYTVDLAAQTVTLVTALPVDYELIISLNVPITQETNLREQGRFFPETFEDALDKLTRIAQQTDEEVQRSIKVPAQDVGEVILPRATDRANRLLAFDADGDPEAGPLRSAVDDIQTIKTDLETIQAAVNATWDSFDDTYLGAKASEPTLDNDGDALATGALFYDTTAGALKVYNGSAWEVAYAPTGDYLPLSGGTMTGQIISTVGGGTPPFVITSATQVNNLNVQYLQGKTWAIPDEIGATTPNNATFASVIVTGLSDDAIVVSNSGRLNSVSGLTYNDDDPNAPYIDLRGGLRIGPVGSANAIEFRRRSGGPPYKIWAFPSLDGSSGDVLTTDGAGSLAFSTPTTAALSTSGTAITYANSTVITSLFSQTLAGNRLGSSGRVEIFIGGKISMNDGTNCTFQLSYGAQNITSIVCSNNTASPVTDVAFYLWIILSGAGTTSTQVAWLEGGAGHGSLEWPNSTTPNGVQSGTSTIDSTVNQTVNVTAKWFDASINNTLTKQSSHMELIA